MAGDGSGRFGRNGSLKLHEPAEEAAVNHRNAVDEKKVGEPKSLRVFIKNRQIGVGVSWAVCFHDQPSLSEIKFEPV